MTKFLFLGGLVFVGMAGWRVGQALSPDAVSMAFGLLVGVMAGVPMALLILAPSRRAGDDAGAGRMPAQDWRMIEVDESRRYGKLLVVGKLQVMIPPGVDEGDVRRRLRMEDC